jgi:hypothetical protein
MDHAPERRLIYACEQVYVIGHPAVGVQADVISLRGVADDRIELVAIARCPEDRFAMVTAKGHMVEPTWDVDARSTWHDAGPSRKPAPKLPRTRISFPARTAAKAVRVMENATPGVALFKMQHPVLSYLAHATIVSTT